ncbi:YbaB/EbfC family nucleoid-associated protein [Longispora sp. K20-0274]|uniref:YbaB/EbfC family nucleoid-associated protein n=1 Tax=Longispora sp. K20-0274 TaxID=3088255 RepID=UPI00399AF003
MTGDLSGASIDQILASTRGMLEAMRAGVGPATEEPVEGTGQSADGRVQAVAVAPGTIRSIELDPRLMRLPSAELAEQITQAVNAALDSLRSQAVAGALPADPALLSEQLAELQTESARTMARFTQTLDEVSTRIRQR